MRKLNGALVLAVVFAASTALPLIAGDSTDAFAGKWILDKKLSNAPLGLRDLEQTIKQTGPDIKIESKFAEPGNGVVPLLYMGVMTTDLTLKADGSETQNQIGPFQQASKTTLNGNQMETDWTATVRGDPIRGHWTRTISPDGKHMTLNIKESSTGSQQASAELHFIRK